MSQTLSPTIHPTVSAGFPRLLGDVGGTHARWAWQAGPGAPIESVRVQACADDATLAASARRYLAECRPGRPQWAGIGIATAVTGDQVRMTNRDWSFSIAALQQDLGLARCLVINDFTALALSLPALAAADLRSIGGGDAVAGAPLALLGPGTGLGVSGLLTAPDGQAWPLAGEGGHVTLAAGDEREAAVLDQLRRRFGHASAERALSGSGLVHLYEALCVLDGRTALPRQPADISAAAQDGSDAQCAETLRLFARLLGSVAGNLALTLGARGGVYVGGGIVPKLGAAFDAAGFRRAFEAKGRFAGYLAQVPTWVIVAAAPALQGASRALDQLPG